MGFMMHLWIMDIYKGKTYMNMQLVKRSYIKVGEGSDALYACICTHLCLTLNTL